MASKVSNSRTIKMENLTLIFHLIRSAPISRADISKKTHMAKSTVTTITNKLIEQGIIYETGIFDTCSGRKPILLDIVENYRYAFGIFITRTNVKLCITNLKSKIICQQEKQIENDNNPNKIIDWACDTLFQMALKNNIPNDKIIGIGVSSPGPLDYKKGIILNPPNLNLFHNYNIKDEIYKRTKLNVFLNVDSVLLSTQQSFYNQNLSDFMFLLINDGLGSAFIINNEIFRGCSEWNSELGHISIDLNGELCSCGNRGCVENYIKLSNLKRKFNFKNYNDVIDSAYLDDKKALEIIDYISKILATAIVNAVNLLGIKNVVLHGDFSYRNNLLCQKIYYYVNSQSFISKTNEIKITFSSLNDEEVLASSTAFVIEEYFNQKI